MRVGATATIDDVPLRVEKITADGDRIVTLGVQKLEAGLRVRAIEAVN